MKSQETRPCAGCEIPGPSCVELDTLQGRIRGMDTDSGDIPVCPLPFIQAAGGDITKFKPTSEEKTKVVNS